MGYIGLPTAAMFAAAGCEVLGVDINPDVVASVNGAEVHIQEPGLSSLVRSAVEKGALRAARTPQPADVHIIAVPTPVTRHSAGAMAPDLRCVEAATLAIASVLKPDDLVVLESTVPPRTCLDVIAPLLLRKTGLRHGQDYHLAHCPERVIPGSILREITSNDRIIGGTTPEATRRAAHLYARFATGRILQTDATTAEMCKLMENTFRDVNIALANEFAALAAQWGVEVGEAIHLANHHPRVHIHTPGIGVGGHCIPVDPWFLIHSAPASDLASAPLLRTARAVNAARPQQVAAQILHVLSQHPGKSLALLGLSYKPDVDDVRESPALEIVAHVAANTSVPVYVVEPHLRALPDNLAGYSNLHFVTLEHALQTNDILTGLVGHSVIRNLPAARLRDKLLIDPLHLWQMETEPYEEPRLCLTPAASAPSAGEYALVAA